MADAPYLIALNLTERCNLACDHCYLDAKVLKEGAVDELGTEELKRVLGEIAEVGPEAMVVLTGGEPMLRRDLPDRSEERRVGKECMIGGRSGCVRYH